MMDAITSKVHSIASNWWLLLLRGLAAIVVGIIAFMHPGATLVALVLVLAFYAVVAGVIAIIAAFARLGGDHWWALLLEGVIGIVVAALLTSWPVASALALVYFVAAWLIVIGIFEIAAGVRLRDIIKNEWLYILSGIVSIGFGVWIFRSGAQGVVAMAFLIGWYFLFYGIVQVAVSFRLRSLGTATAQPAKAV